MLISLIHPGTGSASQYRVYPFERVRLIQSLFGYHHLTLSLMERSEAIWIDRQIASAQRAGLAMTFLPKKDRMGIIET